MYHWFKQNKFKKIVGDFFMITATNNAYTQQISQAIKPRGGANTQKVDLQKHNISVREQNQSFSHTPQVRPSGFADVGKPQPNTKPPVTAPQLRGGKLDISA